MARLEEGLEILLDRDAADIELHRPLQPCHIRMRRDAGVEIGEIDAAPPMPHLGQPVIDQRLADRRRRRKDRRAGRMEPFDIAPYPRRGHARPRRHIVGELGVIGGGEGLVLAQAPAPRGDAQRAFGGEVDRLRREALEHRPHARHARHREADLGIGGARQRIEEVGRDHPHVVAGPGQLGADRLQGAHHPVDLRLPGVGDDGDAHGFVRRQAAARLITSICGGSSRAASSSASAESPSGRHDARPRPCSFRPNLRHCNSERPK